MNAVEAARWLDGRTEPKGVRVFVERVGEDSFRINSQDGDSRGTVLVEGWKILEVAQMFGLKDESLKPTRYAERRAQWVSLCNGSRVPAYPEVCKTILEVKGRTHVWMYEPKFTDSGIALTDRTGSRPEVGRIAGGENDGLLVAVRPYAGYWVPGPWGEIRVFGVKDDIEDVLLMEWAPPLYAVSHLGANIIEQGSWMPSHDWLVVDRDPMPLQKERFYMSGTVKMAGPKAVAKPGQRCAWTKEAEKTINGFVLRLEEWGSRTGSFFGPQTVLVWDGCAASWSEK